MKMGMYSVRDTGAEMFLPPFVVRHQMEAERMFDRLCVERGSGSMIAEFPEQFGLYLIGYWDDVAGHVTMLDVVLLIKMGRKTGNGFGQQVSEQHEAHVLEGSESGDQQE